MFQLQNIGKERVKNFIERRKEGLRDSDSEESLLDILQEKKK